MTHGLIQDVGIAAIAAGALGIPAYFAGLPLILAYLAAGVLLGPHLGFGMIRGAESISTLSEIGLILLMFILGLEIDLRKLLQAGKAVLVNGVTQFVGCALLATALFWALGYRAGQGRFDLVYLAVACSLSSTLVVVKILSDRMELDRLTSRITLGVLVLQDLWAIAFLAVQPKLTELEPTVLLLSLARASLLVGSAVTLARFALPHVFRIAARQPELMLILAMSWCFSMCGLASYLNLSLEMGALVAGVSIASFPYHVEIAAKVSNLRDFFVMLFFVALGLQIPWPTVQVLGLAGAVLAFVLVSRVATIFPVLHGLRYGNRASLIPALNLSQLSEFALVLASLGVAAGHIGPELLAAFTLALVASILTSALMIPRSHRIFERMNPWLQRLGFRDGLVSGGNGRAEMHHGPEVVLLGFHREASSLLAELMRRHSKESMERLLVVDFNPEAHKRLELLGIHCKYGDIGSADTLRHLDLASAKLLVCTIPDHLLKGTTNLRILRTLKSLAPGARVIVTAETFVGADALYREGADYVCVPRTIVAHYLADVMDRMISDAQWKGTRAAGDFVASRNEVLG